MMSLEGWLKLIETIDINLLVVLLVGLPLATTCIGLLMFIWGVCNRK